MKKNLICLAFGGLGIGITEFVMMGLLPDIARSLQIPIPTAGHLISAYAMGVVVGAPILVLFTGGYPPKKLLMFFMALFTVFNSLSALANSYHLLMITRFLSGLPHGAFFGIGAVVANRIAEEGKKSQAVSIMFAGLTVANLIGVPLGTFIGHHFAWNYTFGLIALIGGITIISIYSWLPELPASPQKGIRQELGLFKHKDVWLTLLIISVGFGGVFCWISYIAPLLINVSGFKPANISYIMALAGLGMCVGNIVGGRLADKYSPVKVTLFVTFVMAIALLLVHYTATFEIAALIMTFITGAVAFAAVPPIQMLIIIFARGSEELAAAASQAAFNIANALGAYLGGLPLIFGYGYTSPELVGVAMSLFGVGIVALLIKSSISGPEVGRLPPPL